nr:cellulose synthase-like protein G3 [Tanacetum cinerariifolium]
RVNATSIKSKQLLISAYKVASCDFEETTSWGSEIGFRYGTLTEDTYTSFRLHCEGWKSVFCNPKRAAFVGALCYTHYTLRPFWMIPICIYAFLPQISLINSFPIFTKGSEEGLFLYAFLFLGAYGKEILDYVVFGGGTMQSMGNLENLFVQIFIAVFAVVNSWPIYEGMVIRKDRGRMPLTVTITSISVAIAICLASSLFF